jgi:hypothetical protein
VLCVRSIGHAGSVNRNGHVASFTMDTYVHLLPDDLGEAPASFAEFGLGSARDGREEATRLAV